MIRLFLFIATCCLLFHDDPVTTKLLSYDHWCVLLTTFDCCCEKPRFSLAYHSSKVMRKSMLINHDNSVCHPVMILWIAPLLSAWYVWNYTAIVWLRIELCKGDGRNQQLVFALLKLKQTENQATLWIGLINTYQPSVSSCLEINCVLR